MKIFFFITIIFLNSSLAHTFVLKGSFIQGNLITGKTEPKSKVFIDKKKLKFLSKVFLFLVLKKIEKVM